MFACGRLTTAAACSGSASLRLGGRSRCGVARRRRSIPMPAQQRAATQRTRRRNLVRCRSPNNWRTSQELRSSAEICIISRKSRPWISFTAIFRVVEGFRTFHGNSQDEIVSCVDPVGSSRRGEFLPGPRQTVVRKNCIDRIVMPREPLPQQVNHSRISSSFHRRLQTGSSPEWLPYVSVLS
jgi:hypothetical protein